MRRTAASALVVLVIAAAACSKAERPTLEGVEGTIAPSAESTVATTPGADGATGGSTASTAPAGQEPGTASDGSASPEVDEALQTYFDALESQDFAAARRVSAGGAHLMARMREAVARYNAEREGVGELRYSARSFRVGLSDANRVAYVGSARLELTVSGPAGDPYRESALFENPVVTRVDGGWRLTDFSYDGQPIDLHSSTASKRVGPVDLQLAGALAFGPTTGVIIDLVTSSNHAIKVDGAQLTYADGTTGGPTLGALVSTEPAILYFTFERAGAAPVAWTATVTIDEGTPDEVTEVVVLRF